MRSLQFFAIAAIVRVRDQKLLAIIHCGAERPSGNDVALPVRLILQAHDSGLERKSFKRAQPRIATCAIDDEARAPYSSAC
jgi:hypothetical protein